MSALPLLPDVQRLATAEELPASVHTIPDNIDPSDDGILLKHQTEWLIECAIHDLIIAEKGRRTGITFATALDCAITAATRKADGGDNVYYIGDTKEKGLEFIGYAAKMARAMAQGLAEDCFGIEIILFEDMNDKGETKYITAYRIRFASGHQIVALSSRPENIRGLQGIVVIDEAAFHKDVQAVIDAALALLIWGGKVRIISTHNGIANAFNQLIRDAKAGRNAFQVYTVDFDTAVENGLYERVCFMRGKEPTVEDKEAWYRKIRNSYTNKAAMREELDCIPRDGSGVAIVGVLIDRAMKEERPIVRLALERSWAAKDPEYRMSWCEDWIKANVDPILAGLDDGLEHYFGSDYSRYQDFAVFAPIAMMPNIVRRVPFLLEMKTVPVKQQSQILWHIIKSLPNFRAGAMDATGNGETLAELTADEFGHDRIHQVKLNDAWYRANMRTFQEGFEEDRFDLPRDNNLRNDLRALELINGIIKLPSLRTNDLNDESSKRHGDAAIALALGDFATLQPAPAPVEFSSEQPLGLNTGPGLDLFEDGGLDLGGYLVF